MKTTFFVVCLLATLMAAAAAPAPKIEPRPLVEYDQRYVLLGIDGQTLGVFDTATGIVLLGQQAKFSFDTWRRYDLSKIAEQKCRMAPAPVPAAFSNVVVHGRYGINVRGGMLVFLDTLTGRLWTCRHSKGLLDVWKCLDTATLKSDAAVEDD